MRKKQTTTSKKDERLVGKKPNQDQKAGPTTQKLTEGPVDTMGRIYDLGEGVKSVNG